MAEKEGSKEGGQAYRQEKPGPKCPDFPTQPHTHRKANTRADQRRGLNEPDFGPGNRPTKKKPSSAAFVHRFFFLSAVPLWSSALSAFFLSCQLKNVIGRNLYENRAHVPH